MTGNIILAGVGGQGDCSGFQAHRAHRNKTGGQSMCVPPKQSAWHSAAAAWVSHVRYGDEVFSPMVPRHGADVLIGFEPAEAVRCLPYLRDGGRRCCEHQGPYKPVTASPVRVPLRRDRGAGIS